MNEDIHKELNELSALMAKLKKSDFKPKIDEPYWSESEELLVGLSKISKIQSEEQIEVPSHYWSDTESEIVSKAKLPQMKLAWYRQPKVLMAIAAVFCTVIVSTIVLKNTFDSTNPSINQEFAYSEDELWEYIEQNPQEFTIDKLIDTQLIDSTVVYDITYFEETEDGETILMESEFHF